MGDCGILRQTIETGSMTGTAAVWGMTYLALGVLPSSGATRLAWSQGKSWRKLLWCNLTLRAPLRFGNGTSSCAYLPTVTEQMLTVV